jgi:hypothetical protein
MTHIKWKCQGRRRRRKCKNMKMRKENIVTDLIKVFPGNDSVNTSQHATV